MAITAIVLQFILYRRIRSEIPFLSHAILLIIAAVILIVGIVWSFGANNAVKTGRQPSHVFTNLLFIASLVLVGYLLAAAVYLVLYRIQLFDYLVGLYTDRNLFTDRVDSDYDFQDGYDSSRRMLWWVTFFTVAVAICLIVIAYACRSVVWNRYIQTRATLYVALAAIVVASWIILFWVEESFEFRRFLPENVGINTLYVMRSLAIVCLAVAVLNAIANLIQYKLGFFIFAAANAALLIVAVRCHRPASPRCQAGCQQ